MKFLSAIMLLFQILIVSKSLADEKVDLREARRIAVQIISNYDPENTVFVSLGTAQGPIEHELELILRDRGISTKDNLIRLPIWNTSQVLDKSPQKFLLAVESIQELQSDRLNGKSVVFFRSLWMLQTMEELANAVNERRMSSKSTLWESVAFHGVFSTTLKGLFEGYVMPYIVRFAFQDPEMLDLLRSRMLKKIGASFNKFTFSKTFRLKARRPDEQNPMRPYLMYEPITAYEFMSKVLKFDRALASKEIFSINESLVSGGLSCSSFL